MSLAGKRILVTRSEEQAGELAALIREKGGIPVLFPTIRLVPPDDPGPVAEAVSRLAAFDWILFASANAARFFCAAARDRGVAGPPDGVRVACVGPGTARELERWGYPLHLIPERHTAEGLAAALRREGISGKRFLLPRAAEGREVLPSELGRDGGIVETVTVYRNGVAEKDESVAREILESPPDVCTFASPSSFRNFLRLMGERDAARVLSSGRIAVIGEVTAKAVAEKGFVVGIMPETYTLPGMVEAIGRCVSPAAPNGGTKR